MLLILATLVTWPQYEVTLSINGVAYGKITSGSKGSKHNNEKGFDIHPVSVPKLRSLKSRDSR